MLYKKCPMIVRTCKVLGHFSTTAGTADVEQLGCPVMCKVFPVMQ